MSNLIKKKEIKIISKNLFIYLYNVGNMQNHLKTLKNKTLSEAILKKIIIFRYNIAYIFFNIQIIIYMWR